MVIFIGYLAMFENMQILLKWKINFSCGKVYSFPQSKYVQ